MKNEGVEKYTLIYIFILEIITLLNTDKYEQVYKTF